MDPRLATIVAKVNKKYGEGTVLKGEDLKDQTIPRTTTGSLALDVALGGGWAANQWNEAIGNESAGKTAVVLRTVAANQALDPDFICVWFAAEEFVPQYAEMIGCDLDRMVIVEDNTMEVVFQMAIDVLEERAADMIVIDSLPALVSVREEDGTMEDLQPGQAAFLTGKFFRKASPVIKRSLIEEERSCTGIVINQWREKIGVMHGDPRTTPGGKAKNFYYFVRVECARDEWITNTKNRRIGQAIKIKNVKNKTAPPGEVGIVDFYFADGNGMKAGQFDTLKETMNVALAFEVVKRAGAFYRFQGDQWQGREGLLTAMREDDVLRQQISDRVMEIVRGDVTEEPETDNVKPIRSAKGTGS
jgi:recombination protein RecA